MNDTWGIEHDTVLCSYIVGLVSFIHSNAYERQRDIIWWFSIWIQTKKQQQSVKIRYYNSFICSWRWLATERGRWAVIGWITKIVDCDWLRRSFGAFLNPIGIFLSVWIKNDKVIQVTTATVMIIDILNHNFSCDSIMRKIGRHTYSRKNEI